MKITIIANPKSGSYNADLLNQCANRLTGRFGKTDIVLTNYRGNASEIAAEINSDFIIAAGGDGLINEVARGVNKRTDIDKLLFSALPFGTRNVFCREYNIPLNPLKAVEKYNPDTNFKIPLGILGDNVFTLMCGFGFDAHVVQNVVEKGYTKFKTLAHVKEGFGSLVNSYPQLMLYANGKTFPAYHIIVSLVKSYAGSFTLSNNVEKNMLNTFVVQKNGALPLLTTAVSVSMLGRFPGNPVITDVIKVSGTASTQIDGEFLKLNTVQNYITVKKDAFNLVV